VDEERIATMMTTEQSFKTLTQAEWQASMLNQVAYIKPVVENGQPAFSVHAADGTQLAIISDRETAFAAVRSHDLEPVSVH
jgi:hypothetical protein